MSGTGLGYKIDGKNKLSLSRVASHSLQVSLTGSLIARKMNGDNVNHYISDHNVVQRPTGN